MRKIPVFIVTLDRLDVLIRSCKSYRQLDTEVEIIIHDRGTTHPLMLDYFERLKDNGYSIYYGTDEPDSINASIKDWFSKNDATHYVVTNTNVAFEGSSPNSLNTYIDLLALEKSVTCVGPSLRTKGKLENHKALRINNEIINYYFSEIDSTFAVYKKCSEFIKPNTKAITVSLPHDAILLD